MANWYGAARTNYFSVTDEARYNVLFNGLYCEGGVSDFTKKENDKILHGFGAYGDIEYYPDVDSNGFVRGSDEYEDCSNINMFARELAKILCPENTFILETVGNEKLRYLTACFVLVFPGEEPIWRDMNALATSMSKRRFKNFPVELEY